MTKNAVQIFEFGDKESSIKVRSLVDKQVDTWFVAKDVAAALGYADFDDAIRRHCKKQKIAELLPGVSPGISKIIRKDSIMIPESDVFRLILRSRLEAAERFQDWLVEEVLPALRKHGYYVACEVPAHQEPSLYGYKNTERLAMEIGIPAIDLNEDLEYIGWQTPEIDAKHRLYFKPTREGKKRGILKAAFKIDGDTRPMEIYWNKKACDAIKSRLTNKLT